MKRLNRKSTYHFVEIISGRCIGGGGQPIPTSPEIRKPHDAIYSEDEHMVLRKSHENPE
jgi:iron only hydrogenase large subunit-like protein